jgi:hypothetical protein
VGRSSGRGRAEEVSKGEKERISCLCLKRLYYVYSYEFVCEFAVARRCAHEAPAFIFLFAFFFFPETCGRGQMLLLLLTLEAAGNFSENFSKKWRVLRRTPVGWLAVFLIIML